MAKTYPTTVRLSEEQKSFIEERISEIKSKIDLDIEIPFGLVVREVLDRAMIFHELKKSGHEFNNFQELRTYLSKKYGENYEKREIKLEELLNLLEEYNA